MKILLITSNTSTIRNYFTFREKSKRQFVQQVYLYYCTITIIWLCVKRTSNVHKIEHRNLEIRKTRNDFLVQLQDYLLPLSLKVFRHKEREAQSFYSGFFHLPPPQHVWNLPQWSHRARENQPSSSPRQVSSQLTDFFKISQNPPRASGAWRHSHSLVSVSHLGYCDISGWYVNTCT